MIELPTDLTPRILTGHVLDVLRQLPEGSVQCVVTSPPYWGLRAYGTEPQVWGGEAPHPHEWSTPVRFKKSGGVASLQPANEGSFVDADNGSTCSCGAWRGELGLEPTPDLYVDHLASVFDEVRRVLRDDGTLWLNLGDTYAGGSPVRSDDHGQKHQRAGDPDYIPFGEPGNSARPPCGVRPKNLVGIPWRVAFALQQPRRKCLTCGYEDHGFKFADVYDRRGGRHFFCPSCFGVRFVRNVHSGWTLRAENIWAKPNPMPESVRDRPTRAHEQVFLLTKRARYFYDGDAVRAALAPSTADRARSHYSNPDDNPDTASKHGPGSRRSYPVQNAGMRAIGYAASTLREIEQGYDGEATKDYGGTGAQDPSATKARIIAGAKARLEAGLNGGANLKSVWWIATDPYPDAHFATFPEALAETCLRAGTSERGACGKCGAAWERNAEHTLETKYEYPKKAGSPRNDNPPHRMDMKVKTNGWSGSCSCGVGSPVPCLILDPFCGSGTVLQVARGLGLRSVGIDLKPEYVALARGRSRADVPDLTRWHESEEAA